MLTHLSIRHFGIISACELDCHSGLTAITGETGAGKSILIDALTYCLGARADAGVIRHGQSSCDITAIFDIKSNPKAQAWLQAHDLLNADNPDECIIRRAIHADSRSKSLINGIPSPLQQTREFGEFIVHIHAQHEHQALLKPESQRHCLDNYGQLHTFTQACIEYHQSWQQTQSALRTLQSRDQNPARLALLTYQLEELQDLALQPDEYDSLLQEHKRLSQAENIQETGAALLALFEDDSHGSINICDKISNLSHILGKSGLKIDNISHFIENARLHLCEARDECSALLDSVDINPERLHTVETRLARIENIARKHHCNPLELLNMQEQLQQEADEITHASQKLQSLEQEATAIRIAYHKTAKAYFDARVKAAKTFAATITKQIRPLGMAQAEFSIHVTHQENADPSPHGSDEITFLFSANPGQPQKPFHKVASGGELSRLALAIQVLTAEKDQTPTILFDEVDVGIGGTQAAIVGKLLRTLGEKAQVLCVTHQPQVAASAHTHFSVSKIIHKENTETALHQLDRNAQIEELARMLGGMQITARTRAHAEELLAEQA